MLSFVLLAIGICGFGLAGYLDLRYTEFPDWLPYSIIVLTLAARTLFSFLWNDWSIITNSLFFGIMFLGLGLLLYFARQWGDGDAWLLGALGFMFPSQLEFGAVTLLPFPVTVIFNFLLVSLVYLIAYSVFLGLKNKEVNRRYLKYLSGEKYKFIGMIIFFFGFSWCFAVIMHFMSFSMINIMQMAALPFLLTFILFFSYYAKVVEKNLFKKKIKTSELKEGDVILDGRWKGLNKKDIKEVRKGGKYVWIKEGVRFAPVFVITMIISVFYGDLIFILV